MTKLVLLTYLPNILFMLLNGVRGAEIKMFLDFKVFIEILKI
jgi:hypothetical protein